MTLFSYIATDTDGNPVNGAIEQNERSAVIESLTRQGLRPVSIKETKGRSKSSINFNGLFKRKKVKADELVIFTRQLSAMTGAGVSLLRALTALAGHVQDSPTLKDVLTSIIVDVEGGSTLGDALAKHPDTFNDVYVNMVRAGESAGILEEVLKRLAFQQEKNMSMRKKLRSAMIYPTVLVTITVISFFGLMLFVVPQIGNILDDLGGPDAKLPGITLFMLGISGFVTNFWYLIILLIGGGIYFLLRYIKTGKGHRQLDSLLLRLPAIKNVVRKLAVARFARTFSALMGAGVAVLEALHVTARAVGNVIYQEALTDAAEAVKEGKTLSKVIANNDLFPAIVAQMLLVGEETGQTDTVLVKVADFYEEEVDVAIDGLSSIIEPVMIVVMGGTVGLIAASVMIPIASIAQNIQ